MKTFSFCSLPEYLKGINLLHKPGSYSTATILVALVPKMNEAGFKLPAPDKSIALIAASVLNFVETPPDLQ